VSCVALIPARGGSVRIPQKNRQPFCGHPLLAYSIAAAKAAQIFTDVIVCTDDDATDDVARWYGASVWRRREALADEPDIAWLCSVLTFRQEDAFALLRPTSPFRTAATIRNAWDVFQRSQPCDSLRAVQRCKEHPGKMWVLRSALLPGGTSDNPALGSAVQRERLFPLLPFTHNLVAAPTFPATVPWHSSPTQTLPEVYVQNASLEIAWRHTVLQPSLTVAGTHQLGSLAGDIVAPFFPQGYEGFDINTPDDFAFADWLVATGRATLPAVPR
jgi:CMP-N,N'-diacetyllegionaminic acid synthase